MTSERTIQGDIFGLRGAPRAMLDVLKTIHVGSPDIWTPRRLVLANWWLFDEPQEIYFGRGNLMLTGKNEAGKSTVLITIITLVLDRMFTPERIDTTGGKDKVVRYYLVGKDEAEPDHPFYHEDRTGYIGLEFERGNSGRFRTIGIALRTSRKWPDRRVVPWSFVLHEGCRLEYDVQLIDPDTKRPLSRTELRDRIGSRGRVFDDNQLKEYQEAVNELLFGFGSLDDFDRYIDVLHVLRTPKLGDGLSPERVEKLLVDSLPPVDMAPIDQAAELFRKMDTIEAEIRRLQKQKDQADELEAVQVEVIETEARLRADHYLRSLEGLRQQETRLERLEGQLQEARRQQSSSSEKLSFLADELAEIEGPLEELEAEIREHGSYDTERRLGEIKKERTRLATEIEQNTTDRGRERQEAEAATRARGSEAGAWLGAAQEYREQLGDLIEAARTALWMDLAHRSETALVETAGLTVEDDTVIGAVLGIGTIAAESRQRLDAVRPVTEAHERVEAVRRAYDEAVGNTRRARKEHGAADDAYAACDTEVDTAQGAVVDDLLAWRDAFDLFAVGDGVLEEATDQVLAYDDPAKPVTRIVQPLKVLFDAASAEAAEQVRRTDIQSAETRSLLADVEAEVQRLEADEDIVPARSSATARARTALLEAGIPTVALYEACAFTKATGSSTEQARLEEALEAAGLLDALIVPADAADRAETLLAKPGLGDRWLRPALEGERSPWLAAVGTPTVGAADAQRALDGIICADAELPAGATTAISRSGRWRTGGLEGIAAGEQTTVRYVGEANRRAERDRRLEAARAERDHLSSVVTELDRESSAIRDRATRLASAWDALREADPLRRLNSALVRRGEARKRLDGARRILETLTQEESRKQTALRQSEAALEQACGGAPYLRGRSAEAMRNVATMLTALPKAETRLASTQTQLYAIRGRYADARTRIDTAERRVGELSERVEAKRRDDLALRARVEHLQQQLAQESVGLEELRQRRDTLAARKKANEDTTSTAHDALVTASADIRQLEPQVADRARERNAARVEKEATESQFLEILSSYPTTDAYAQDARDRGFGPFALQMVGQVDRRQIPLLAQQAHSELLSTYHRVREAFGGLNPRVEKHLVLFSDADGELRVADLRIRLEDELAKKERALEEKDQEIIENVFLRSVAEAIRKAIGRTRAWVTRVNDILERMDLFKGGTMQIKWRVRQRRTEDAYDPKDLDDLFSRTGIALPEERQQQLIQIFRDMIAEVRRCARDNALAIDYHAELTALVDYKQWYSLEIERKDETGRYRRLTRKIYGYGSMGRRSLDLILPLIAAVHARLSVAAPDAPRLVGFDEAFAGVDDQNAAQIYRLLSGVGMNWVMATEKATNFGPHLPGVATYEFLNDGRDVAPTATVWDGRVQHSFEDEELGRDTPASRHSIPAES